jgi:hypothetical protein
MLCPFVFATTALLGLAVLRWLELGLAGVVEGRRRRRLSLEGEGEGEEVVVASFSDGDWRCRLRESFGKVKQLSWLANQNGGRSKAVQGEPDASKEMRWFTRVV